MEINWTVREYLGVPVRKVLGGKALEGLLTEASDLQNGDRVEACGLVFDVVGNEHSLSLKAERHIGHLSFDKDDRHCWVCSGIIGLREAMKEAL